jgi:hypothetical protein
MPYIYSLAGRTYIEDYTMMRGLTMDFPKDKKVYEIKDEFMFGDSILVSPVTDYMYHTPPQISKLVPKEAFKNGLKVKYYKDKDFKNLTREDTVENIDLYWYTGRPDYVTNSEYSVHWEGTIVAPETGKYQFQIKSFDSRVIIFNGKKLNVELSCNEPYFEFLELEKGKEYPIICETQNNQTELQDSNYIGKHLLILKKRNKKQKNQKLEMFIYLKDSIGSIIGQAKYMKGEKVIHLRHLLKKYLF